MSQLLRSARRLSATLTGAVFLCLALAANATAAAATYTVTITSDGINSVGTGNYKAGTKVSIAAGHHPDGTPFLKWTANNDGAKLDDAYSEKTTFTMPRRNVTVTAEFGTDGGLKRLKKTAKTETETYTDTRDNKTYGVATIGNRKWMTENLNYTPETGGSWCYGNDNANCEKYGRLYDWTTAMNIEDTYKTTNWSGNSFQQQGICPAGWRVPSNDDWSALITSVGTTSNAGTKLKATSGWSSGNGTDDYGFSALPGGYYSGSAFSSVGANGFWWTNKQADATAANAGAYYIGTAASISGTNYTKIRGFSVRCVAYAQKKYTVEVNSEDGVSASGNGDYEPGTTVTISTGIVLDNMRFVKWTVQSGGVTLGSANSATTTFTMPGNDVTVTAVFGPPYTVEIAEGGVDASGRGTYWEGDTVNIKAGMSPVGKKFKMWTTQSSGVTFFNAYNENTKFVMPGNNVTVTAVYGDAFTDSRNNKTYGWVTIGNRKWMTENLNFDTLDGTGSRCYNNSADSCAKYGRLYNWTTAMSIDGKYDSDVWVGLESQHRGVCPKGWRLPSADDWDDLRYSVGTASTAGSKLKAKSGWTSGNGSDEYGFSALPGGSYNGSAFASIGTEGTWWMTAGYNTANAYRFYLNIGGTIPTNGTAQKNNRSLSVRCVAYTQETYTVNVISDGISGVTGGGNYEPEEKVVINAGTAPDGKWFSHWTAQSADVVFEDAYSAATAFTMPGGSDVTVTAIFSEKIYEVTIEGAGKNAVGDGYYVVGGRVTITAGTAPADKKFQMWTSESNGVNFNFDGSSEIMVGSFGYMVPVLNLRADTF
ncbi:hypothetical protein R80B4_02684 [Fibrobacteres bacterium R8-0-B4]